jgi:tetrahydromethanopterin S-methyltransferase subunit H
MSRVYHRYGGGVYEVPDKVAKAMHYRTRAEELRTIAAGIFDREEREMLMEIAKEYERFAREAEGK